MITSDLESAIARWAADSGCRLAILFGSAANPSASDPRDIDLAVEFEVMPGPETRLALIGSLQDVAGRRVVDLVFLHRDTDPVLLFEVFRGGRPLYEGEPGLFVRGAVRAAALYDDAEPFRRALRERMARPRVTS